MDLKRRKIVKIFNRYNENMKVGESYIDSSIIRETCGTILGKDSDVLRKGIVSNDLATREIAIAEIFLARLDRYERDIVKLKYIEKAKASFVADAFYTSKSTLYRRFQVAFEKMYLEYDKLEKSFPDLF